MALTLFFVRSSGAITLTLTDVFTFSKPFFPVISMVVLPSLRPVTSIPPSTGVREITLPSCTDQLYPAEYPAGMPFARIVAFASFAMMSLDGDAMIVVSLPSVVVAPTIARKLLLTPSVSAVIVAVPAVRG